LGFGILRPRAIRHTSALLREARRKGVGLGELGVEDGLRALKCRVDPRALGLPGDDEIVADRFPSTPGLAEAELAMRAGDWEPAACLLSGHGRDWDRRDTDVAALAESSVDDGVALRNWMCARPDDPNVLVLGAETLARRAWKARGARVAPDTTAQQFRAFFRLLDEAERMAWAATEAAPADPTPWMTLSTLGRGQQWSGPKFERVFGELLARAPHHRGGHEQALQYWCAKWAGSDEQMFAFADAAAAASPALTALPLIAVFEHSLFANRTWSTRYARRALDNTLAWLADDGRHSLYAQHDHGLAAQALVKVKRYDEAVEQFRLQGMHADAWVWGYAEDARLNFVLTRWEACNRARRPRRQ
jgi:hypothetical protein